MVATITGETVSAPTASKLTRDLDEAVRQFHQARLIDDYVYAVSRWGQLAGEPADGPQASADAGDLWHPLGRMLAPVSFPAQSGRGPGGLGSALTRSVPARIGTSSPAFNSHRWLCRVSDGDSHRLSAGLASALLGAQNAQHP